jgi:imidazolonepropionase-like amidohydrolase
MRLETKARLHLEAMARHRTTTVEVKTGCGPDPSAEMKILRVLTSPKAEAFGHRAHISPAPATR